jgi:hypothetical protein
MTERLETLPAMQVARVWFPVPARPTFSVEKCNPASGGTFSSTAIEIIKWVNKFAVAKVCVDLRLDWLCIAFKEGAVRVRL